MNKITELTPAQEIRLNEFYQEQLEIGRSIKPIDHEKVERIITKFYSRIGLPKPTFYYHKSPYEIVNSYEGININMYFGGQQWLQWKAFYKFAEEIGVKFAPEDSELLAEWCEESRELHWWFPFEKECLISERPIRLHVDSRGFLHSENSKAIEYPDGWGMYYLNGVKVTEYLVMTPAEDLDIKFFLEEKNADVKAEFVRKFGVERMLHLGTKVDSYEKYPEKKHPWWHKSQYEVWDMKELFPGLAYQPYLKMLNQTTGIWHMEALSPACRTLVDAIKERFGGRDFEILKIA